MQTDHFDCDCLDCVESDTINSIDSIIGQFISSNKPINVYEKPGGKLLRTIPAGKFVGKVESLNTKGNWIKLPDYSGRGYIVKNKDLSFRIGAILPPLTNEEKIDIALNTVKTLPGGQLVEAGEIAVDAGKGVISFLGQWKFILIAVIIVLILLAYLKFK